jgi:predicted CXXCH cytochrome family protein
MERVRTAQTALWTVLLCLVAGIALSGCTSGEPFDATAEAQYVGSETCADCHDRTYNTWQTTLHSQVIQKVSDNPRIVQGDFGEPFPEGVDPFGPEDAMMIHGVQWKQRYVDSDWRIRGAQWNFDIEEWKPYHADTWTENDWRQKCASCHVTGFDRDALDTSDPLNEPWAELGIGCEACHGPGSQHVAAPAAQSNQFIVNPAKLPAGRAADTCGQCHVRGKSPDGEWDFPIDYLPGDDLTPSNFTYVPLDNEKAWWPDGSIKQHRQQNIEWETSGHAKAGVTCIDCHTVHSAGTKFQTRLTPNAMCVQCHSTVSTDSVTGHAPIAGAPQHSNCVGCHMSPTGKSADFGDEHTHRFKVVRPQVTIDLGDGDPAVQPNSCNLCHAHADDEPARLQRALESGIEARFDMAGAYLAGVNAPKASDAEADEADADEAP